MEPTRSRTRLVVCVDGTLTEAHKSKGVETGSHSNIYRIKLAVKEGQVKDCVENIYTQKSFYHEGIGVKEASKTKKWWKGATASGIKRDYAKIYTLCCTETQSKHDQIWLFGYSRGAHIVRVVADMIHHLGIIDCRPGGYVDRLESLVVIALGLYKSISDGALHEDAPGLRAFKKFTRPSSPVFFVGAIDAVAFVPAEGKPEDQTVRCRHFRHALSTHEERKPFRSEIPTDLTLPSNFDECIEKPERVSMLQAWFFGTHTDLGGRHLHDGIALYPLQWLLSEAQAQGLVLGFQPSTGPYGSRENPLELVKMDSSGYPHSIRLANGIEISMRDLRSLHQQKGYGVQMLYWGRYLWSDPFTEPRQLFEGDNLVGWNQDKPSGTFIHPSLFLIHDCFNEVLGNAEALRLGRIVRRWRKRNLPTDEDLFWTSKSLGKQKIRPSDTIEQDISALTKTAVISAVSHLRLLEKSEDQKIRGVDPPTDHQPFRAILNAFKCPRMFSNALKLATEKVEADLARPPSEVKKPDEAIKIEKDKIDVGWQRDPLAKRPTIEPERTVAYGILQSKIDPAKRTELDKRLRTVQVEFSDLEKLLCCSASQMAFVPTGVIRLLFDKMDKVGYLSMLYSIFQIFDKDEWAQSRKAVIEAFFSKYPVGLTREGQIIPSKDETMTDGEWLRTYLLGSKTAPVELGVLPFHKFRSAQQHKAGSGWQYPYTSTRWKQAYQRPQEVSKWSSSTPNFLDAYRKPFTGKSDFLNKKPNASANEYDPLGQETDPFAGKHEPLRPNPDPLGRYRMQSEDERPLWSKISLSDLPGSYNPGGTNNLNGMSDVGNADFDKLSYQDSSLSGLASVAIIGFSLAATATTVALIQNRSERQTLAALVDAVLIMTRAFCHRRDGPGSLITDSDVTRAAIYYRPVARKVHDEVKEVLPVRSAPKPFLTKIEARLQGLVDKYKDEVLAIDSEDEDDDLDVGE